MTHLHLDPEILVSGLRGEDSAAALPILDAVLTTIRQRLVDLSQRNLRTWDGPAAVLVIAPSSVVLKDWRVADTAEALVRLARPAGVSVRLIDVLPPLRHDNEGRPIYPIAAFGGSAVIREFSNDGGLPVVTFHQVTPAEMTDLVEQVNVPRPATPDAPTFATGALGLGSVEAARADERRSLVEHVLLTASRPLTLDDILDQIREGGCFPADYDGLRHAVQDILTTLVDDGWAERWMEVFSDTYQVIERYEPGFDDVSGVRAAIREVMLRRSASDTPIPAARIVAEVSTLDGETFPPHADNVTGHIAVLVSGRFLAEPRPGFYVVTHAARRYHESRPQQPIWDTVGYRSAVRRSLQVAVSEAVLTFLQSQNQPATSAMTVLRVYGLLEQSRTPAVCGTLVRSALRWLVQAGHVTRVGTGFELAPATREELIRPDGLDRRRERLAGVRGDVLQAIGRKPGMTQDEIREEGSFFGTGSEAVAMMLDLVAAGEVTVLDRKIYPGRADQIPEGIQ